MIITDGTSTFTNTKEDIAEREIWNDNQSITIGGRAKSQADSTRLQIDSDLLLTNTQYISLKAIIENFGQELTYTPTRILFGRPAIAALKVIAKAPSIKSRVSCGGEISYIFSIRYEEVID